MIDIIYGTGVSGATEAGLGASMANGILTTGFYSSSSPTSLAVKMELFNLQELDTDDHLVCVEECLKNCDGAIILRSAMVDEEDDRIDDIIDRVEIISKKINFMNPNISTRSIVKFIVDHKIKKLCIIGKQDTEGTNFVYKECYALLDEILSGVVSDNKFVVNQY